jgi:hypothetical protein
MVGVVSAGEVPNTASPVPVLVVSAVRRFPDVGVARKVATLVPKPLTPVDTGSPVQFVSVPDVGVPKMGVISVGVLAKTAAPVPVSSDKTAIRLADVGVAKNVAMLAARPLTPVAMGRPVQFVKTPAEGVPRLAVVSVTLVNIFAYVICLVTLL